MAQKDITLDDVMGAIIALRTSVDERFDRIEMKLEEAAAERQAIREVVDNELAGQGQVMVLEGQMQEVQRTLRQQGKKLGAIGERLDRAKV